MLEVPTATVILVGGSHPSILDWPNSVRLEPDFVFGGNQGSISIADGSDLPHTFGVDPGTTSLLEKM